MFCLCSTNLFHRTNLFVVLKTCEYCRYLFQTRSQIMKTEYELRHVCLSVSPSVNPHGTTWYPLDGFSWNLAFIFLKYYEKIQLLLKGDKNNE
jgi:hypothetical protein